MLIPPQIYFLLTVKPSVNLIQSQIIPCNWSVNRIHKRSQRMTRKISWMPCIIRDRCISIYRCQRSSNHSNVYIDTHITAVGHWFWPSKNKSVLKQTEASDSIRNISEFQTQSINLGQTIYNWMGPVILHFAGIMFWWNPIWKYVQHMLDFSEFCLKNFSFISQKILGQF